MQKKPVLKQFYAEYFILNDPLLENHRRIIQSDTILNASLLLDNTEELGPGSLVITRLEEVPEDRSIPRRS